jgi:hypothetical protein
MLPGTWATSLLFLARRLFRKGMSFTVLLLIWFWLDIFITVCERRTTRNSFRLSARESIDYDVPSMRQKRSD